MKIYVGNLDYKVNESDLSAVFEEFGTVVSCQVITDKYSGRSKGFAFVEMEDNTDAKNAIEELNGTNLNNRDIIVNEAKPKKENTRRY